MAPETQLVRIAGLAVYSEKQREREREREREKLCYFVCVCVCVNIPESGGRVVGENKALTAKRARFTPYATTFNKCRICKQQVHQAGSHYCQGITKYGST